MSTFKFNKGKLVEQPIQGNPFKIICVKAYEFEGREFKVGDISENSWGYNVPDNWEKLSLRTYIAEGFSEDELVEEKDLEIVYQIESKCGWYSIPYEIFKPYPNEARKRIIARKVTKEEGEKPEMIERVFKLVKRISATLIGHTFGIRVENDLKVKSGGRTFIQIVYSAACMKTNKEEIWHGRKWYLSEHMTDDEIIKSCYAAFEYAIKHEVMEGFKVDGITLFNPHLNFEELLKISHHWRY